MQRTNQVSDVVVLNGVPADQQWMDQVTASARKGGDDWPHPHQSLPTGQVTQVELYKLIAAAFAVAGRPWSVATDGYPPIDGAVSAIAPPPPTDDPDPSRGSSMHNLLHSILGDFH